MLHIYKKHRIFCSFNEGVESISGRMAVITGANKQDHFFSSFSPGVRIRPINKKLKMIAVITPLETVILLRQFLVFPKSS